MSVFDRLFGKSGDQARLAQRAEADGDLSRAASLWIDAGRRDEAARVMMLRGDAELDAAKRLQHYLQAIATAPADAEIRTQARRKRALLAIEMTRGGAASATARRDLMDAAAELESLGEAARAAEAYALAGDLDGEARALISAGEVDKLEDVLERDEDRARSERHRRSVAQEVEHLVALGQRRQALARGEAEGLIERARALLAQRAMAPRLMIELRGHRATLVLGDEVVLGRTDGAITIASHAVSRRHVAIARAHAQARIEVRDLGSRNGTELRGMRIGGAIAVPVDGDAPGLDLKIGGEVPLRLAPSTLLEGALAIEVGGAHYVAPLGTALLGVGSWALEAGIDGWIDLVTGEGPRAYLGMTELGGRTALLTGDAIGAERGGPAVLRVLG